jgi:hypothetical protein
MVIVGLLLRRLVDDLAILDNDYVLGAACYH